MNMGLVQSFWAQNSLGMAFMWKQVGLISYENTTTSGSSVLFAWTKRLEFWCENELGARLLVPKTTRDSFCAKTIRAYLARKYYTFGIAFMSSFLYKIRCQSFGAILVPTHYFVQKQVRLISNENITPLCQVFVQDKRSSFDVEQTTMVFWDSHVR